MAMIEINWNPSARELRRFASAWFPLFFILVGGLVFYKTRSWPIAAAIWTPAFLVSLAAYLWPRFARLVFVGWMCAAFPIGWTISHLLLAFIYYVVLTPIGLLMRLVGRDPMERSFDRKAASYWVPHNPGGDTARYFRQF
jgi:hypothetical protein